MIQAKPERHPGFDSWKQNLASRVFARMIRVKPARHSKAMMWASPTRHPGGARMILALRGCHGGFAAMIIFPHLQYYYIIIIIISIVVIIVIIAITIIIIIVIIIRYLSLYINDDLIIREEKNHILYWF
jgi:hypothetical protein